MENVKKFCVDSSRFGKIFYEEQDILFFPRGIPAFEENRSWVLVGDNTSALKWLQNIERPSLALPVTSPDAVKTDYNARIPDDDLALISETDEQEAPEKVSASDLALLIVVSIPEAAPWNMSANLRAPILINLKTRRAVQVIALNEEYPIRHIVFPDDVREKMRQDYQYRENQAKAQSNAQSNAQSKGSDASC